MVDRYWREIEDVENDVENCLQISSILLKLKEFYEKLNDILEINDNEKNISSNLSKINNNKTKINENIANTSSNASNIAGTLFRLDDIESDLSKKIDSNENNITNNLSKIDIIKNIYHLLLQLKKFLKINIILKTNHLVLTEILKMLNY